MYLKRRHNIWWAFHDIPRSLRAAMGHPRFAVSLETDNEAEARRRAAPLEVRWRAEIEKAKRGTPDDPLTADAAFWRRTLHEAKDEGEREIIRDMIADKAADIADTFAARRGIAPGDEAGYEAARDESDAARFQGLALGKLVPLDTYLDEFLATLTSEAKSKDQKRSSVLNFRGRFPLAQDISQRGLQQYIHEASTSGAAVATIKRHVSELRTYWQYLASLDIVGRYPPPFEGLSYPNASGKQQGQTARQDFEPAEVVRLHAEAARRGDQQLADLIQLAMYTGARLEELCALPLSKVAARTFDIEDAKSKAGWRTVPIHSRLRSLIKRLKADSEDGFLLSGLSVANKYEDRSPGIGKRFGRLKASLGFPETKVFHSIRKTVTTLLERAGVPENVAADIVGHDKPGMTYGLYASGTSLAQRKAAVERIAYPRPPKA